ncbi:class I SAM-dependent methyltransferase [Prochlorococcus sp. AH-736-E15]|nr:class I SAM-dependent methyltransferase [Prochlorococcus sp. AH-736-E15]
MSRLTPFKIARNKLFNLSLRKFTSYFYYKFLEYKDRKYSFSGNFNYQWDKINFNRTALINYIICNHPLGTNLNYLEIGTASNENFNAIPIVNKTGVDPDMGGNIRLTSDDFFKSQNKNFDLIFIDGLHTYEQVKKDFTNSLAVINEGGIIILDDMIPRNWKEQQTPRVQSQWTGDVWKLLFDLNKLDGINYKIILIDNGQCVIFPKGIKLNEQFLLNNTKIKTFDYFYNNFKDLPTIELEEGLTWIRNILKSQ